MFAASFERFGSAIVVEQKKGMDNLVTFVNKHQKEHGRMLAEIFMLYELVQDDTGGKSREGEQERTRYYRIDSWQDGGRQRRSRTGR